MTGQNGNLCSLGIPVAPKNYSAPAKAQNLSHTKTTLTAAGLHSSDAKISLFRLVSNISALLLVVFRTVDGGTPPTQTRLPKKGLFAANEHRLFETRGLFPKCKFHLSDFWIALFRHFQAYIFLEGVMLEISKD